MDHRLRRRGEGADRLQHGWVSRDGDVGRRDGACCGIWVFAACEGAVFVLPAFPAAGNPRRRGGVCPSSDLGSFKLSSAQAWVKSVGEPRAVLAGSVLRSLRCAKPPAQPGHGQGRSRREFPLSSRPLSPASRGSVPSLLRSPGVLDRFVLRKVLEEPPVPSVSWFWPNWGDEADAGGG